MSQTLTFTQMVNRLFFGIDVSNKSDLLVESFHSVPQLQHLDNGVKKWNLNVAMEMQSAEAWSTRHDFIFTQSPLPELKIEKGIIEVALGETDTSEQIINLYWRLEFTDKASAEVYFNKLKQQFDHLATDKKFELDKDLGEIAQFSNRNPLDPGVRDITLLLRKSLTTKKYEIALFFGSEFMAQ